MLFRFLALSEVQTVQEATHPQPVELSECVIYGIFKDKVFCPHMVSEPDIQLQQQCLSEGGTEKKQINIDESVIKDLDEKIKF